MKLSRPVPTGPTLPLSPLIDVVFILLIFVILVARFSEIEALGIDLPVSAEGASMPSDVLVVRQLSDERWLVGRDPVHRHLLPRFVRERSGGFTRMVVVADRTTPLERALEVVAAGRAAGIREVAVATRPP